MEIKFMGITHNQMRITGRVIEEPKFIPWGESECTILKVKTINRIMDANSQWVDEVNVIPVTVTQPNKVETVRNHVHEGRQLSIDAYYKSWEVNGVLQHGVILRTMQLGDKPYEPENANISGSSTVDSGLPPY